MNEVDAIRIEQFRQFKKEIRGSKEYLIVGIDVAKEKHHAFFAGRLQGLGAQRIEANKFGSQRPDRLNGNYGALQEKIWDCSGMSGHGYHTREGSIRHYPRHPRGNGIYSHGSVKGGHHVVSHHRY